MAIPPPQLAWSLDGTTRAAHGGVAVRLHGTCNWTSGHAAGTQALLLEHGCFASVEHRPSMLVGVGSLSVCVRLRSAAPGALLLSKLGAVETTGCAGLCTGQPGLAGYGLELGDERGLGVNLADIAGVSAHEELGRSVLADGQWHHTCLVLDRGASSHLAVYVDGRPSERLALRGSRLARLGSLDSSAALLLGRRSWDEPGTRELAPRPLKFPSITAWSSSRVDAHSDRPSGRCPHVPQV